MCSVTERTEKHVLIVSPTKENKMHSLRDGKKLITVAEREGADAGLTTSFGSPGSLLKQRNVFMS